MRIGVVSRDGLISTVINVAVIALTITIVAMMGACSTTDTRALQNARVLYSQAYSNPVVVSNASASLSEAAATLQKAEKEDNAEEQRHLALVAQTQIRQALTEAQEKQADKEASHLREQRAEVLIQTREREAQQARTQAALARAQADATTREMQMAQQQAQMSRRQAEQARQETMELRKQLEGIQARETERGLIFTLSDIYFKVNRADLEPGAVLNLARLAEYLKRNPGQKVLIEGHTDSAGGAGYNLSLSQQRANSVRDMLIANGADPNQITAKGYGESFPVASNTNTAGRQQNRRVDIVLSQSG